MQKVTSRELADLTEEDLRELGLTIGERRRFRRALAESAPAAEPEERKNSSHLGTAESRPLTVLFADLVDSTGIGERLASEDLLEVMRVYRELCGEAVTRFGGYIARFIGDGILAYFCYPVANENDPERAVRAALEITGRMGELQTPAGVPLEARIGLATGRVLVSDLFAGGSTDKKTILGSCPNLAARLQALAEPNSIVISDRTYQAVSSHFDCEDLGEQRLKGFKEPHRAWKLVQEKEHRSRRLSVREQPDLCWPRNRARDAPRLWRKAERGQGAAVLVTGEAGIGKSRLIEEFFEEQSIPESGIARIGASPFDENSSLRPFTDYLRTAAGIVSGADPGALQRVRNLLSPAPRRPNH
jgi:class 3 adenylate cyclase